MVTTLLCVSISGWATRPFIFWEVAWRQGVVEVEFAVVSLWHYIDDPEAIVPDKPGQSSTIANAVSLKLPEFWPSDPELSFAQAEALFQAQHIIQEKTKFNHVIRILTAQYAFVRGTLHATINRITKCACPSKWEQLQQQLLNVEDLSIRNPSQLLQHMLKLQGARYCHRCQQRWDFSWAFPARWPNRNCFESTGPTTHIHFPATLAINVGASR